MRKLKRRRAPVGVISTTYICETLESRTLLSTMSLLKDINLGTPDSTPSHLGAVNGKLWFIAYDSVHGAQPWVSDGTAAGTTMISTGASILYPYVDVPYAILGLGTRGFFIGIDSGGAYRLYSSTGSTATATASSAGTALVASRAETSFQTVPLVPTTFNNAVYFLGSIGTTAGIVKTDGTVAGTGVALADATLGNESPLVPAGNHLFYNKYDGTNAHLYSLSSTNQVTSVGTFAGSRFAMDYTAVINNTLYFIADSSTGIQLWKSDGTTAGTTMLKELIDGSYQITATNGIIYIVDTTGFSTNLYKSDGTAAGTTLYDTFNNSSIPYEMVGVNGGAYFLNSGSSSYNSLWFTDGTAANTYSLMPAVTQNANPTHLVAAGSFVYFDATDATHGNELWQTDGTVSGTQGFDVNPGIANGVDTNFSSLNRLLQVGSNVYASVNNGTTGYELYRIYNQNSATGTAGNDAITLTQDIDHTHIDWKVGATTGQVAISDPVGLKITGNGGNDSITLISTNGNPLPNTLHLDGVFTLNGLTGTNPLANTTLDINASTLFITYANAAADPISTIKTYLKNGYNAGDWTGTATSTTGVIKSAVAAANSAHSTGIAYADSADALVSLPANTIELKYTLYGDTGLTGDVGFTDFMRMTQHFTQASGATWGRGDFNYDGAVNAADFNLLQPNYGTSLPAPAPVPTITTPVIPARPARVTVLPPASELVSASSAVDHVSPIAADASNDSKGRSPAAKRRLKNAKH